MTALRPRNALRAGLPAAFLLAFLTVTAGAQTTYNSVASGLFTNPATWTPAGVPGAADTAIINSGHTVDASSITVGTITVNGGGSLVSLPGGPVTFRADTYNVLPGGTIRGFDGVPFGGRLDVQGKPNLPYTVNNDGLMRGGNPGGFLFVYDSGPGGDIPCPNGSAINSIGGSFLGGTVTGGVYLLAQNVNLQNATVTGGSGFSAGSAGPVYIAGINLFFTGTTFIQGGTNTNLAGQGGSVKLVARSCNGPGGTLFLGPLASATVGGPLVAGCPGVLIFAALTSTVLGTVSPGPTGCAYWDPPTLKLEADARVHGGTIQIAGGELDATGLATRTDPSPAVDAGGDLTISLNPGGYLDLRGLTSGTTYFRAGGDLVIHADADAIILDPGVTLADLMDPMPVIRRSRFTYAVDTNADSTEAVTQTTSVMVPIHITNVGSVDTHVEAAIADSANWMSGGPQYISQSLAPGETVQRDVILNIPDGSIGDHTLLRVSIALPDGVVVQGRHLFKVMQ